jgi:hypothetical protein
LAGEVTDLRTLNESKKKVKIKKVGFLKNFNLFISKIDFSFRYNATNIG